MSILETIAEKKREDLVEAKSRLPFAKLLAQAEGVTVRGGFGEALQREGLQVIAEFKRASPSKGIIRPDLTPVEVAKSYEQYGAAAMSVLTEEHYFKGSTNDLRAVRAAVKLPILRKDFIVDGYQIAEARLIGADAILLIVALLEKSELAEYLAMAQSLGLAVLTEVHNARELETALEIGSPIIGINNRNLHTFETSLNVTAELAKEVPAEVTLVSESGIHNRQDIEKVASFSVQAVLIGESLMRQSVPGEKLKELLS